jgi:O-antigen/teichoic acid export membrane protein
MRVRVVKNTFVLLAGQAALIVSSAITTLLLARGLGPDQFGEYNAVIAFVGLFLPIANFGLDIILVRELSQNPRKAGRILGAGILLRLATSVIAILFCIGSSWYFGYSAFERMLIALWSLSLLLSSGQLLQVPFTLELNNLRPVRVTSIAALTGTLLKLVMILAGLPLASYLVLDLLTTLTTSIFLWRAAQHHSDIRPEWNTDRQVWRALLHDCFPLLVSSVFIAVYHRIDQQFLLMWKGTGEVGEYASAVRVAELLNLVPVFLMRSAFPIIAAAAGKSEGNAPVELSRRCYRYLFAAAFPVLFAGIALAPQTINLLYGKNYSGAAPALPWLMAAEIPIIAGIVYGHFSVASNLQRFDVLFTFLNMCTNLGLCVVLIPAHGLIGAAIASLISYSLSVPLQLLFKATRKFSVALILEVTRFLAVGTCTLLAFRVLQEILPLALSLLISGAVFAASAFALKLVTRKDIEGIFA